MTKVKVFYIFRPFRTWFLMNVFVTKNKTKKTIKKAKENVLFNKKTAVSQPKKMNYIELK